MAPDDRDWLRRMVGSLAQLPTDTRTDFVDDMCVVQNQYGDCVNGCPDNPLAKSMAVGLATMGVLCGAKKRGLLEIFRPRPTTVCRSHQSTALHHQGAAAHQRHVRQFD